MKLESLIEKLIDMRDNMECAGYDVVIAPAPRPHGDPGADDQQISSVLATQGETVVRLSGHL